MAQLNFDATQVAPDLGFETVPAGWYNAMIDESEMKPTKDGSGAYLQTRFNIIDGQYANRKIYMRLNLRNTNPVAQEIAYKQLSAIAHAVGVLHIQDSSQLHGLPMKIKVKLRKDPSGQYEDSNEISAIKNINEQVEMGSPQAGASPAGFGAAPSGMPPGFGGAPGFAAQPPAGFGGAPMQQPPMQQAPVQQPAAQPWQQPAQPAPQAAPQQPWQQPAQQPAAQPQQAPAQAAPVQQPWQQPAAAQPWQQAPQQQAPVQQAAPQQAPVQQAHPAQSAVPPWAQPQQ